MDTADLRWFDFGMLACMALCLYVMYLWLLAGLGFIQLFIKSIKWLLDQMKTLRDKVAGGLGNFFQKLTKLQRLLLANTVLWTIAERGANMFLVGGKVGWRVDDQPMFNPKPSPRFVWYRDVGVDALWLIDEGSFAWNYSIEEWIVLAILPWVFVYIWNINKMKALRDKASNGLGNFFQKLTKLQRLLLATNTVLWTIAERAANMFLAGGKVGWRVDHQPMFNPKPSSGFVWYRDVGVDALWLIDEGSFAWNYSIEEWIVFAILPWVFVYSWNNAKKP